MICSFPVQAMKLILLKLGPITEEEIELPWVAVGEAFEQMIRSAAAHIHKEHFDIVFKCLEVHWLFFFLLLFFYSWVTEEKFSTYWEKYLCFIGPELGFLGFFLLWKHKIQGHVHGKNSTLLFLTSELPWWLFCEWERNYCRWDSVLWLGEDSLYDLPLHTLQSSCWNVVIVFCCWSIYWWFKTTVTVKGKLFALQSFLKQRLGLNLEIQVGAFQPSTEKKNVFSLGVPVLLLGDYTLVWRSTTECCGLGCVGSGWCRIISNHTAWQCVLLTWPIFKSLQTSGRGIC